MAEYICGIDTIDKTECIGNSLSKINNNFVQLDQGICDVNTKINNLSFVARLSAGNNIALTPSSGTGNIVKIDSTIPALALPKAYALFDVINNVAYLRGTPYNISTAEFVRVWTIGTNQRGVVRLVFQNPLPSNEYVVLGSNLAQYDYNTAYEEKTTNQFQVQLGVGGQWYNTYKGAQVIVF